MDYEKKYKEMKARVLEIGQGYVKGVDFSKPRQIAEYICPELVEIEDEKMLRVLREGFNILDKDDEWYSGITNGQILAWLEKQGEPEDKGEISDGTQAHVDKVEQKYVSKFHEGDWVACNSDNLRSPLRIVSVSDTEYRVEGVRGVPGRPMIEYLDRHYHLWTIKDAKDGDMLTDGSCIFIIKKLNQDSIAEIYCCLFDDGDFEVNSSLMFAETSTYPATKKQRDILFQKMNEAGYEWNAEKKELKELSHL